MTAKGGPALVVALLAFALALGAIVRLSLAHADATGLISYLTTVGVPAVPAVAGWWTSRKARKHSADARDAAIAAENNTNGKMDIRFTAIDRKLTDVIAKVDQHLVYHSDSGEGQ